MTAELNRNFSGEEDCSGYMLDGAHVIQHMHRFVCNKHSLRKQRAFTDQTGFEMHEVWAELLNCLSSATQFVCHERAPQHTVRRLSALSG